MRGTEYRLSATDDGVSRTEVLSGSVGVASSGVPAVVQKGFGTVAMKNSPPKKPVRLLQPPELEGVPEVFYRIPLTFKLNHLEEARNYRVQVARSEVFQSLLFDKVIPDETVAIPELNNGTYFLRINGIDQNGLEGFYAVRSFLVAAHPVPPIQITPALDSVVEHPAVFQWSIPADAVRYHLQVSKDKEFNQPLLLDQNNLKKTRFTAETEMIPGEYHWRVATINSAGKRGPFSDTLKFRVAPPQPDLSTAELDDEGMVFRWRAAEPGQTFTCQIARDKEFTELIVDREVEEPQLDLQTFEPGSYFIRIAIIDADGYQGPFAPYQTIKVPSPPPHPLAIIGPILLLFILIP